MGLDRSNSLVGGSTMILISVDDAIIFASYGHSKLKNLQTIKKLVGELRKYRNISKMERKSRMKDCWRFLLNLDAIAYEWVVTKREAEKISTWQAYELLWGTEIWLLGKKELYRYMSLGGSKMAPFNQYRLHHEAYDFKHLFTQSELIPKDSHGKGTIGKVVSIKEFTQIDANDLELF